MNNITIKRRLGVGGTNSSGRKSCPDFFELEDGSFAIIGKDMTESISSLLPVDASCGQDERIVVVPRIIVTSAKNDIPDE